MAHSRIANQVLITTASVLLVASLVWVGVSAYGLVRRSQALNREMEGAINWGQLKRIKQLLDQGANPRCSGAAGITIAMAAADYGDFPLLERVLQFGEDVNRPDTNGATVLYHAVHRNAEVTTIKWLLERGSNPNCVTKSGDTPLNRAVAEGHESAVGALLDAGANVNFQKDYGPTPLYIAVDDNNLRMVQVLLARGADPRQRCNGHTVLSRSIRKRDDALRRMGAEWVKYHIDLKNLNIARIPQLLARRNRRRLELTP